MSKTFFQMAIDGPVAAGKGTVAKLVATRLGFLYVDTGAMYRTVALLALRQGIDPSVESQVVKILAGTRIELRSPLDSEKDGRLSTVLLNGQDVSWQIRTREVSEAASKVAAHPSVRQYLVEQQQAIAHGADVVMEGRDITYRVLPDAQLKIYLTASEEVRAARRQFQFQEKGEQMSLEQVLSDLRIRDKRDKERGADPLKIVEGAWVLDTSKLGLEEVVEQIMQRVHQLRP